MVRWLIAAGIIGIPIFIVVVAIGAYALEQLYTFLLK